MSAKGDETEKERKREKEMEKKTNTKIEHMKAVMKGESEGEHLLVGCSDRQCAIFMLDQGQDF